ncbi:MAG: hypothetical protein JXA21_28255 [Anaerolineae bacterium]|nr:hypothetical protein [Anaerolineae bacterium]
MGTIQKTKRPRATLRHALLPGVRRSPKHQRLLELLINGLRRQRRPLSSTPTADGLH